jgi:hypothetical protein
MIEGVVVEVVVDQSNPTSQAQTYIVADFTLGSDRTKRARVHIRFTQLKEAAIPLITPPNAVNNEEALQSSHEDNANNNNNIKAVVPVNPPQVIDNLLEGIDDDAAINVPLPDVNPPVETGNPLQKAAALLQDSDDEADNTAVVTCHGQSWYNYPPEAGSSINGPIPYREWGLRIPTGQTWRDGINSDETITRLDVFCNCFRFGN